MRSNLGFVDPDPNKKDMNVPAYNTSYLRKTGLLEYAASNDIIVLFPQSNITSWVDSDPQNTKYRLPFTWEGYSQSNRDNPQTQAVVNITKALFGKDLFNEGVGIKQSDISLYFKCLVGLCIFVIICSCCQYQCIKKKRVEQNTFNKSYR